MVSAFAPAPSFELRLVFLFLVCSELAWAVPNRVLLCHLVVTPLLHPSPKPVRNDTITWSHPFATSNRTFPSKRSLPVYT